MLLSKSKGCCKVLLYGNGTPGMFYSSKSTGSPTGLGGRADVVPDCSFMDT